MTRYFLVFDRRTLFVNAALWIIFNDDQNEYTKFSYIAITNSGHQLHRVSRWLRRNATITGKFHCVFFFWWQIKNSLDLDKKKIYSASALKIRSYYFKNKNWMFKRCINFCLLQAFYLNKCKIELFFSQVVHYIRQEVYSFGLNSS